MENYSNNYKIARSLSVQGNFYPDLQILLRIIGVSRVQSCPSFVLSNFLDQVFYFLRPRNLRGGSLLISTPTVVVPEKYYQLGLHSP